MNWPIDSEEIIISPKMLVLKRPGSIAGDKSINERPDKGLALAFISLGTQRSLSLTACLTCRSVHSARLSIKSHENDILRV